MATVEKLQNLVSLERGEVDRSIFSDAEIFEQEMRTIFRKSWLFLCHESQIPKKGDFFEAPMGRDNVLVVRQKDGGIKALLNSCLHRGNAVCRADEGNARNFMCTYHGWTYDLAGKLVGVPRALTSCTTTTSTPPPTGCARWPSWTRSWASSSAPWTQRLRRWRSSSAGPADWALP